jgi:hypothetical protein
MNRAKWISAAVTLALIGVAGLYLSHYRGMQKLGRPGVKAHALGGTNASVLLQVELPARVLDYESEFLPVDDITRGTLPGDTSFGTRRYKGPDGFTLLCNAVLMGADRSSMHKPQFCLEGQGWHIDRSQTVEETVHIARPRPYELPVVKLISDRQVTLNGQTVPAKGIYVYWYVADGKVSASESGVQRMWWMARDLFCTGVLQRWAYVSCFVVCSPGQEDQAYERIKQFVAAAVPEFQNPPEPASGPALAAGPARSVQ